MPQTNDQLPASSDRLSLGQAARLTGVPKAYLRELADSGQLAVYTVPGEGGPKRRVSQIGLTEVGLLSGANGTGAQLERADLSELVALVREQSARITALEEQRFQLGAQLGAALERIGALEERIEALPSENRVHELTPTSAASNAAAQPESAVPSPASPSTPPARTRDAVWQLSDRGLQRTAQLGAFVLSRRPRLLRRSGPGSFIQ